MSYVIGLTGGIGSGKTVVSDHLATLGVPIIDTDVIARNIVEPGQATLQALITAFGGTILHKDGMLNRDELRKIAFSSKENKSILDAITHPAIRAEMFKQIQQVDYPYCVVVIPLLSAQSNFADSLDRIIVVTTDLEIRIQRVMKRSNLSRDEVMQIIQTQISDTERLGFADDVITNDGTIDDAHRKAEGLHQDYLRLAKEHGN